MGSFLKSVLDDKGAQCAEDLLGFNVTSECLAHLVSKALSYGIIAGAMFVKVPQISKIHASKSTRGLSASAFMTELVMYTVTLSYFANHPDRPALSTYGEYVFLLIQAAVLVLQVFTYDGASDRATPRSGAATKILFVGIYLPFAFASLSGIIPFANLQMLFNLSTLMLIYARVPQVLALFREKSAGELSSITCLMTFAGSGARLGTLLAEGVSDISALAGNGIAVVLNGIICAQIFAYGSGKPASAKREVTKPVAQGKKSTPVRRASATKKVN